MASTPSLAGQIALVTGGGRGLGRVYARALAAEGAAVALLSRTVKELAETASLVAGDGGRARAYPGDVTDPAAVAGIVASVERDLGPITLLVNAAGVAEPFGPLAESDPAAWWRGVAINAFGPFLTMRYVLPGMVARGRGRIVNVSSGLGTRALPNVSSYVIGKTALTRLTECAAMETRGTGVSVFSISPGMVRTEMNRALRDHPRSKEWFPWVHETLAAGRDTPPDASVALVLRLARGDADALTGRHVTIADDLDRLIGQAQEVEETQALLLRLAPLP